MATLIRLIVRLLFALRPKNQPLRTYDLARGSAYVSSLDLSEFVNYGLPACGTTCVNLVFCQNVSNSISPSSSIHAETVARRHHARLCCEFDKPDGRLPISERQSSSLSFVQVCETGSAISGASD